MSKTYPLETIKLFYGYAHDDIKLAKRLGQALIGLKRENYLETWSEGEIRAGSPVDQEIEHHITNADILLLLLSPAFLASDYCYQILLQQAAQRHKTHQAITVLILLKPVDWSEADFSSLRCLPSTKEPVSKWKPIDDAFYNIAQGIRSLLKEVWLLKGETYSQTHNFEMALYAFDEAIHLDHGYGLAYISKGQVQRALKDHEGSKKSFELALERDPANADVYCELGVTYRNEKDYDRALDFFNQALGRKSLYAEACIFKGLVLKEMGKIREARKVFDDFLKMRPDDPMVTPFQAMLSMEEPDNDDGLNKLSSDAHAFTASLSQISFDVLSRERDPLIPFLRGFSRFAETLVSILRMTEMHVQERLNRLESTNHSLLRSTANIKNTDEPIQRALNTFIRLEGAVLERQMAQMTPVFYELRGIGSQSISEIGSITQRLMALLQQLSSDLAREDGVLKEQADQLAERLWLQHVRQTYGILSSNNRQADGKTASDTAPFSIPTDDSPQPNKPETPTQLSPLPPETIASPVRLYSEPQVEQPLRKRLVQRARSTSQLVQSLREVCTSLVKTRTFWVLIFVYMSFTGITFCVSGALGFFSLPGIPWFHVDLAHRVIFFAFVLVEIFLMILLWKVLRWEWVEIPLLLCRICYTVLGLVCLCTGLASFLYQPFYAHYSFLSLTHTNTLDSIIYLAIGIPLSLFSIVIWVSAARNWYYWS